MRIFVVGESRFGSRFFRAALAAGHELVAVSISGRLGDADPLLAAARSTGVPAIPFAAILDGDAAAIRGTGAELIVLANVSRIVPPATLSAVPRGAICFHPSLLPRHRGRHAVRDAIRAGDPFTGVTAFWPDDGVDTGPVILQARVEIAPGEPPSALYHDKLVPIGVYIMLAAIAAIEANAAPRLCQEAAL